MLIALFGLFSLTYLFVINSMTNALCVQKEIPAERQPKIFRTINILLTILLTSTFVELWFT
ncbi:MULTISPECIES: hypothetical protein [Salibacterium]|uniref:Uncharacterized protein n=2 Tax=Salibacterium TaxID=1884429 RepID=A0A1I4JBS6_9BACI|nr:MULTISPECIES: hypothetical protein [Salibacterium]SFL63707.1 hypothetical protein SAMN04488054_10357 [Salibacterium qingdaonense]SFP94661.1 hypothetical protein SAMN05518683_11372 [Salibacterium halotolerans]